MTASKAKTQEEILEVLEPVSQNYEFVLGEGDDKLVFYLKPLTFFGKMKFFSAMGKSIEKVLSSDVSISEIIDVPEFDSEKPVSKSSVTEADVFIKAVSKIVQYAPETLGDLFCVILGVPDSNKEYVKARLENELTDDQAEELIGVFLDQNWEVMYDFFTGRLARVSKKISSKFTQ